MKFKKNKEGMKEGMKEGKKENKKKGKKQKGERIKLERYFKV